MGMEELPAFMASIRNIESGSPQGNYGEMGIPTKYGRALGAYQIMSKNWPSWAAEAGLPGANWRDPRAQDAVAEYWFRKYYARYGRWDLVAAAWLGGPGTADRLARGDRSVLQRKDGLGTSIQRYMEKVMLTMAQLQSGMGAGRGDVNKLSEIRQKVVKEESAEFSEAASFAQEEFSSKRDLFGPEGGELVSQAFGTLRTPGLGGDPVGLSDSFDDPSMLFSEMMQKMQELIATNIDAPTEQLGVEPLGAQPQQEEVVPGEVKQLDIQPGLDDKLRQPRGGNIAGNVFDPQGIWDSGKVRDWGRHIEAKFGLTVSPRGHHRSPQQNKDVGGAKNSDHLWGGALDFFGPKEKMDQLAAWARQHEGPGKPFRIVLWQTKGHFDHVHVSFHKNSNIPAPL